MNWRIVRASLVVLVPTLGLALLAGDHDLALSSSPAAVDAALPSPHELLDALPKHLTSEFPRDVDRVLLAKFKARKELPHEHLLFNLFSWREFVAVTWPLDDTGQPLPSINDPGRRLYDTWKTDGDTFLPDGSRPAPWGTNHLNVQFASKKIQPGVRAFANISAVHGTLAPKLPSGINDVIQAFKSPVWDQNGWMLRYEICINKDEFEYIVGNGLYSLDGQAAFSQAGGKVSFPVDGDQGGLGSIELKLAWKVLDESTGDLPDRFVTTRGTIFTGPNGTPVEKLLGLVGMHIGHRTQSSPQWIWSTFMHVDSLQTDSLETHHGKSIKPLFADPTNEIALINTPSQANQPFLDGQTPTQVLQLTPVPAATERVNHVALQALRERKSVLQYYKLLDTQWPTDPAAVPSQPGVLPDSINNKPGGRPTPVYLVNPLLETYFQVGNQPAANQEEGGTNQTLVFGTESCMGCHSSAAIATRINVVQGAKTADFGPQLSGDFSWLLQHRAHYTP
jgi:hypothetical protein